MPEEAIRVAVLGRPNVGKSSLVNALVGQDRVIVSEIPGTTRDTVDTVLRRGDRTFVLVDTAGLRRKRRQRQGIEYYSELRARQAAERADVALVVASKWDITRVGIEDLRPRLQDRLKQRPRLVAVSAKTGRGVDRLLDRIEELYDKHTSRIGTGELNRFLGELRDARQPPSRNGKRLNLLYGTQTQVRPPRFRFFVNDPGLITRDYGYWVENQLRDQHRAASHDVAFLEADRCAERQVALLWARQFPPLRQDLVRAVDSHGDELHIRALPAEVVEAAAKLADRFTRPPGALGEEDQ